MAKRILSVLLAALFLFNVIGIHSVYWLVREHARTELIRLLDNEGYSEEETIHIKIPLTLAYPINNTDYERVNGSFQHEGEFYKLIKQKIDRDTLHVVCIRDYHEKRLYDLMADFVKVTNDLPASSKTMKLIGSFSKDFETSVQSEISKSVSPLHSTFADPTFLLFSHSYPVPYPPPRS